MLGATAVTAAAADGVAGSGYDRQASKSGAAVDAEIVAAFAGHQPDRWAYRTTPFRGAWKDGDIDVMRIEAETSALMADQQAGIVMPRQWLERTIAAIGGVVAIGSARSALARQREVLSTQLGRAPARPGIGRLKDGRLLYSLLLKRQCGDGVEPAIGRRRLQAEMNLLEERAKILFSRIGIEQGSIGDRYRRLWRDVAYLPDQDRALRTLQDHLVAMRSVTLSVFGTVPDFCSDSKIAALSQAQVDAGVQGYRVVPRAGVPGLYVADLGHPRRRPVWTLPSVVAHEALPGHLLQLGIESEAPPSPERTTYASAFVEGWAIHAETLVADRGAFTDPRIMLGHLHWLIFRVARGLADVNIHLGDWSLSQARSAMLEWQGEPVYYASFDADLDRIAVEPASRLADALCWLTMDDASARLPASDRSRFERMLVAGGRKRTEQIIALAHAAGRPV